LRPEIHDEPESTVQIDLAGVDIVNRHLRRVQPWRTITLHAPAGTKISDAEQQIAFDPRGHRLAWMLEATRSSPLGRFVRRWIRSVHVTEHHRVELWVSRPDGSRMREVGYVALNPEDDAMAEGPHYLQWLPDGEHVSFIYRNALWTVPVD
jgi:hypothetical protein